MTIEMIRDLKRTSKNTVFFSFSTDDQTDITSRRVTWLQFVIKPRRKKKHETPSSVPKYNVPCICRNNPVGGSINKLQAQLASCRQSSIVNRWPFHNISRTSPTCSTTKMAQSTNLVFAVRADRFQSTVVCDRSIDLQNQVIATIFEWPSLQPPFAFQVKFKRVFLFYDTNKISILCQIENENVQI